ncbi:hypothetical protein BG011_008020 [Mortierella polycephala]|uniref:Uncharacterized protein n=1 Tax=Mortierella polycephala TaxID=41804 RepID=A0A9P6QB01_9FUNG|nr:hypothetical protein BG011_008020 [Mortierella polycephala]
MHQDHNVPWHALATHFSVQPTHHLPEQPLDLSPRNLPTQQKTFIYFAKCLATTIRNFAATERQKYPDTFPSEDGPNNVEPSADNSHHGEKHEREKMEKPEADQDKNEKDERDVKDLLFTKAFAQGCNDTYKTLQRDWGESVIPERACRLQHWIDQACYIPSPDPVYERDLADFLKKPRYDTGNLDLADIVKILIIQNQMEPLLRMANNPKTPLFGLYCLGWGHSFGWSRLSEYALMAYIAFNVLAESPALLQPTAPKHGPGHQSQQNEQGDCTKGQARYCDLPFYKRLVRHLTSSCDGDAQTVIHHDFLHEHGAHDPKRYGLCLRPDVFDDMHRMKEYLKICFACLYRSEMLARECGHPIEWEKEILFSMSFMNVAPTWEQEN